MLIPPHVSNRSSSSFEILAHQLRDKTEEMLLIETDEKIRQIYDEKIKRLEEPLPLISQSRSIWNLTQIEAFKTFIEKHDLRIVLGSTPKEYYKFIKEHFPEIKGSKSIFTVLPDLIPELRGKNKKQTKFAYVNYLNPLISKTPLSLKGFLLLREGMKIQLTVAEIKKALFEENNKIHTGIQDPIELKSLAIYPEPNQYTPDLWILKMISIIRKEDKKLKQIYDLKITKPRVSLKRNPSEFPFAINKKQRSLSIETATLHRRVSSPPPLDFDFDSSEPDIRTSLEEDLSVDERFHLLNSFNPELAITFLEDPDSALLHKSPLNQKGT